MQITKKQNTNVRNNEKRREKNGVCSARDSGEREVKQKTNPRFYRGKSRCKKNVITLYTPRIIRFNEPKTTSEANKPKARLFYRSYGRLLDKCT